MKMRASALKKRAASEGESQKTEQKEQQAGGAGKRYSLAKVKAKK